MNSSYSSRNPNRYTWHPSLHNPRCYTREVMGAELIEDFWNRCRPGHHNMFMGVDVETTGSVSRELLIMKARSTWGWLRFQVPTLASYLTYGAEGQVSMAYDIPSSVAEVGRWIDRTFRVREGYANLDDLRYLVGQHPLPEGSGEQSFVYFVPRNNGFGVLFHLNDVTFDGVGMKILMTMFLKSLAESLEENAEPVLEWGAEVANLPPAAPLILGEGEIQEGPKYQEALLEAITGFSVNQPRMIGLKGPPERPGYTRRVQYGFNPEESAQVIMAIKSKGFTVNQVALAAVSMVIAEDNSMAKTTPADATLLYFGVVDARHRLAKPYKTAHGYPGVCLASTPIVIPMVSFKNSDLREPIMLLATAQSVKRQYLWQKS